MARQIHIDTIKKRSAELAPKLGEPADDIAEKLEAAYKKQGFEVTRPAELIPVKRFNGTPDSRFPATMQL